MAGMGDSLTRQSEGEVMDSPAEAQAYARADFSQVNQLFVDRLLELAGNAPALAALDLGTGPADIPIRLARLRADWLITAIDASEAMLGLARQAVAAAALEGRICLLQRDAKKTSLPGGSFDVIFSNSILHHVANALELWREIRRLARPGALVFMRDLFRPPTAKRAADIVAAYASSETPLLQEEYYRSLLAAYTPEEIVQQLRQAKLPLEVKTVSDRHVDVFGRLA
jgi:ubiquinone/menaquinone biosynthesis C-methylase UbiE